jgi:hypothetical protein
VDEMAGTQGQRRRTEETLSQTEIQRTVIQQLRDKGYSPEQAQEIYRLADRTSRGAQGINVPAYIPQHDFMEVVGRLNAILNARLKHQTQSARSLLATGLPILSIRQEITLRAVQPHVEISGYYHELFGDPNLRVILDRPMTGRHGSTADVTLQGQIHAAMHASPEDVSSIRVARQRVQSEEALAEREHRKPRVSSEDRRLAGTPIFLAVVDSTGQEVSTTQRQSLATRIDRAYNQLAMYLARADERGGTVDQDTIRTFMPIRTVSLAERERERHEREGG